MSALSTLPGAERFFSLLQSRCPNQTLTIGEAEVLDWSYGVDYTKRYSVYRDGAQIGEYKTFGPKPGDTNFTREYHGAIPGYAEVASLVYCNTRFELGRGLYECGQLITTPWQRQDGHEHIVFP